MPDFVSDETFERNVLRVQLLTEERILNAKSEQFRLAQGGELLGLADVLVRLGDLTPALRERIEQMPAVRPNTIQMLGPFKVLRQIGEGSMGTVYLALDTRTDRKVALKTLPKRYAEDSEFLARFQREARAAKTIIHENIVAAYESGEDQGYHYFAMEFCKGEPLDRVLGLEKRLNWLSASNIVLQVTRGLECAHMHGFIHRDVKPGNIILVPSNNKNGAPIAKLLDLGLTKNILHTHSSFRTEAGAMLGTPQYISPEQARGDETVDGRSDIYSLGATYYHLVTGAAPFEANSAEQVIQKHLSEPLSNPQDLRPDIPDGVALIIQRMMAKEPADRYQDATVLLRDLEHVMIGKPPVAAAVAEGRTTVARPKLQRKRAVKTLTIETSAQVALNSKHQAETLMKPPETRGLSRVKRGVLMAIAAFVGVAALGMCAWYYFGILSPARIATPIVTPESPAQPVHAAVENRAAEILIDENFETLNLDALPATWLIHPRRGVSFATAADHGQVLRMVKVAGAGDPYLEITLRAEPLRGRMLRSAVNASCPSGFGPYDPASKQAPGLSVALLLNNGVRPPVEKRLVLPQDVTWKRLSITQLVPQNAAEITIRLSVSGNPVDVLFDDLKVDLLPGD